MTNQQVHEPDSAATWGSVVVFVGLTVVLLSAAVVAHEMPRPAPPAECYTTLLGSTGFCTGNQDWDLIEWGGWIGGGLAAMTAVVAAVVTAVGTAGPARQKKQGRTGTGAGDVLGKEMR